eukprot:14546659-Ditylum_brightwellii.AAC.1
MRVNEGALQLYKKITDQYITCMHDHTCLLANGDKAAQPYQGLFRRPRHAPLVTIDENQSDLDESKVAQQSTYDTSYPAGLAVKQKNNNKIKLATVLE